MTTSLCFLADESCDFTVVRALRAAGYDVMAVSEVMNRSDDRELIEWASREQRVLLTEDKDFGELVHLKRMAHAGVVLLRLNDLPSAEMIARVVMVLDHHANDLINAFTTIDQRKVRIRRMS